MDNELAELDEAFRKSLGSQNKNSSAKNARTESAGENFPLTKPTLISGHASSPPEKLFSEFPESSEDNFDAEHRSLRNGADQSNFCRSFFDVTEGRKPYLAQKRSLTLAAVAKVIPPPFPMDLDALDAEPDAAVSDRSENNVVEDLKVILGGPTELLEDQMPSDDTSDDVEQVDNDSISTETSDDEKEESCPAKEDKSNFHESESSFRPAAVLHYPRSAAASKTGEEFAAVQAICPENEALPLNNTLSSPPIEESLLEFIETGADARGKAELAQPTDIRKPQSSVPTIVSASYAGKDDDFERNLISLQEQLSAFKQQDAPTKSVPRRRQHLKVRGRLGKPPPHRRWRFYMFENVYVFEPNKTGLGLRYQARNLSSYMCPFDDSKSVGHSEFGLNTIGDCGDATVENKRRTSQSSGTSPDTRGAETAAGSARSLPQLLIFRESGDVVETTSGTHELYKYFGKFQHLFLVDLIVGMMKIAETKFVVLAPTSEAAAGFHTPALAANGARPVYSIDAGAFDAMIYRISRCWLVPLKFNGPLILSQRDEPGRGNLVGRRTMQMRRSGLAMPTAVSRGRGAFPAPIQNDSDVSGSDLLQSVATVWDSVFSSTIPELGLTATNIPETRRTSRGSHISVDTMEPTPSGGVSSVGWHSAAKSRVDVDLVSHTDDFLKPPSKSGCRSPVKTWPSSQEPNNSTGTGVYDLSASHSAPVSPNFQSCPQLPRTVKNPNIEHDILPISEPKWPSVGFGDATLQLGLEDRVASYKQAVEKVLCTSFYYSYDIDITHSLQRKQNIEGGLGRQGWPCSSRRRSCLTIDLLDFDSTSGKETIDEKEKRKGLVISHNTAPKNLWSRDVRLLDIADRRFLWNHAMLEPFFKAGADPRWFTPVVQGSASSATLRAGIHGLDVVLLCRRSCRRAGTRYHHRGLDDDGNVANFNESEFIVAACRIDPTTGAVVNRGPDVVGGGAAALVQIRGSVPLFWWQNFSLQQINPLPEMTRELNHSWPAFVAHQRECNDIYGPITYVNLLSRDKNGEPRLTIALNRMLRAYTDVINDAAAATGETEELAQLRAKHVPWDFHAEVKAQGFEAALRKFAQETLAYEREEYGYFCTKPTVGGSRAQVGVVRTNCLDCLDRTNAFQCYFCWTWLASYLRQRGLKAFFAPGYRCNWNGSRGFKGMPSNLPGDKIMQTSVSSTPVRPVNFTDYRKPQGMPGPLSPPPPPPPPPPVVPPAECIDTDLTGIGPQCRYNPQLFYVETYGGLGGVSRQWFAPVREDTLFRGVAMTSGDVHLPENLSTLPLPGFFTKNAEGNTFNENDRQFVPSVLKEVVARLWADQGDRISRAYTGTGSVLSHLVRRGRKSLSSNITHIWTSIGRLYQNTFEDANRQEVFDLILGLHTTTKMIKPPIKQQDRNGAAVESLPITMSPPDEAMSTPPEDTTVFSGPPTEAEEIDDRPNVYKQSRVRIRTPKKKDYADDVVESRPSTASDDALNLAASSAPPTIVQRRINDAMEGPETSARTPHKFTPPEGCDPGALNIWFGTWNVAGRRIENSLVPWLFPYGEGMPGSDVYVIAVQELVESTSFRILLNQSDRDKEGLVDFHIRSALKQDFSLVASQSLVGLYILVFARTSLVPLISDIRGQGIKLGFKGQMGNKGAVMVRFMLGRTSFCFVNVHLSWGSEKAEQRRSQLRQILAAVYPARPFPRQAYPNTRVSGEHNWPTLGQPPSSAVPVAIQDHDCVIIGGDFNFRCDVTPSEAEKFLEYGMWRELLLRDQFLTSMECRYAVDGIREAGPVKFLPTYKYKRGTTDYDMGRTPAWCDRILLSGPYSNDDNLLRCVNYDRVDEFVSSDHRPIFGIFHATIFVEKAPMPTCKA